MRKKGMKERNLETRKKQRAETQSDATGNSVY